MTPARRVTEGLDATSTETATAAFNVRHRSLYSAQLGGTVAAAVVALEWRLRGGAWIAALAADGSPITRTGAGLIRAVDVAGVDDVRLVVSEAGTGELDVIQEAW